MVFKRYSSPFIFLDTLILQCRFSEGIDVILKEIDEEQLWELYLSNPVKDKSFLDWKNEIYAEHEAEEIKEIDFEAAKKGARNILKTFKPY